MNVRSATWPLAALMIALAAPAQAQFYAGGQVGRSDASAERQGRNDQFLDLGFSSATTSSDHKDTAYRIFAGYLFMPYLGVEAAYTDLGSTRFRTDVDPPGALAGETSVKGEELSAVGRYPIGDRFAVYGRAGVYFARTQTTYRAEGSVELVDGADRQRKRTTKPVYSVGATYAFTQQLAARVEWARHNDLGDDSTGGRMDVDFVSVGIVYTF